MGNTYTHIIAEQEYRKQLLRYRIKSDATVTHPFEVWAAKYFYIDEIHTLKLNNAQRSLLNELELRSHLDGKVRILVPHAKNLGISTFCEAYFFWLQCIAGQPGDAAFIYPRASQYRLSQRRFLSNARAFNNPLNIPHVKRVSRAALSYGKNGTISSWHSIRTANAIRNLSPRYSLIASAECSSVSEMTDEIAMGFKREPLYEAYLAANNSAHPRSILIIEGNSSDCHEDSFWRSALEAPGSANFSFKFIPWHESELNYCKLDSSVKDFYNSLDEYEYSVLWSQLKLTLEQINWYRNIARKVDSNTLRAQYPSTLAEALRFNEFARIPQPFAQFGSTNILQPRHIQAGMHTRCETTHAPHFSNTSLLLKNYTMPGVAFSSNLISTPSFVLESDSDCNFSVPSEKLIVGNVSITKRGGINHTIHPISPAETALLHVTANFTPYSNHTIHSTSPAEAPLPHITTNIRNSSGFTNKINGYFADNLIFNNPSQRLYPKANFSVSSEKLCGRTGSVPLS